LKHFKFKFSLHDDTKGANGDETSL